MKIFSIGGWSGSGKTTLITRLIEKFKSAGRRVVALKHAPHGPALQPESKDSARFLKAGADRVFLSTPELLLQMSPIAGEEDLFGEVKNALGQQDWLLLEGFYHDSVPLIEVFDSRRHRQLKFPASRLAAVISDRPLPASASALPAFNRDDIEGVAAFMEGYHD